MRSAGRSGPPDDAAPRRRGGCAARPERSGWRSRHPGTRRRRPRGPDGEAYVRLDAAERDLSVEVQSVKHGSRVHLDIETDDVEAEVRRLERLGAKRVIRRG
ncbi:VOC family protein [Sorangium sp. So ce362]